MGYQLLFPLSLILSFHVNISMLFDSCISMPFLAHENISVATKGQDYPVSHTNLGYHEITGVLKD